jgi:hypothetical protein
MNGLLRCSRAIEGKKLDELFLAATTMKTREDIGQMIEFLTIAKECFVK